ncbi:MAG TPA: hypothetical protein VK927_04185 [Adhaeribacter sp.]|nr:hypothetical protein [Adhaeribacter sp.]
MNRFLLAVGFLLCTFTAFGQQNQSSLIRAKIKDGSIMVGGDMTGSYQKYNRNNGKTGQKEKGDLITFRLNTKTGYFFLPDFVVGVNIALEHTSINVDSTFFGERQTYLLAGPFVRYYLDNGIFGELNVNAGLNAIKDGDKTDIKSAAVGIGYAYFFNEKVAIEPMISFHYVQNRIDNADRDFTDKQFGPVFTLGIQAYLWSPTRVLPTK